MERFPRPKSPSRVAAAKVFGRQFKLESQGLLWGHVLGHCAFI